MDFKYSTGFAYASLRSQMFRTHDPETANISINATQNEGREFTPAYAAKVLIGKPPLAPPELWLDPIPQHIPPNFLNNLLNRPVVK